MCTHLRKSRQTEIVEGFQLRTKFSQRGGLRAHLGNIFNPPLLHYTPQQLRESEKKQNLHPNSSFALGHDGSKEFKN